MKTLLIGLCCLLALAAHAAQPTFKDLIWTNTTVGGVQGIYPKNDNINLARIIIGPHGEVMIGSNTPPNYGGTVPQFGEFLVSYRDADLETYYSGTPIDLSAESGNVTTQLRIDLKGGGGQNNFFDYLSQTNMGGVEGEFVVKLAGTPYLKLLDRTELLSMDATGLRIDNDATHSALTHRLYMGGSLVLSNGAGVLSLGFDSALGDTETIVYAGTTLGIDVTSTLVKVALPQTNQTTLDAAALITAYNKIAMATNSAFVAPIAGKVIFCTSNYNLYIITPTKTNLFATGM